MRRLQEDWVEVGVFCLLFIYLFIYMLCAILVGNCEIMMSDSILIYKDFEVIFIFVNIRS